MLNRIFVVHLSDLETEYNNKTLVVRAPDIASVLRLGKKYMAYNELSDTYLINCIREVFSETDIYGAWDRSVIYWSRYGN